MIFYRWLDDVCCNACTFVDSVVIDEGAQI